MCEGNNISACDRPKKRKKNTKDRERSVIELVYCVAMHMWMHWFYELSVKSGEGWHGRPRGILSLQSPCLLAAKALTTLTTRHPHTECTNTNRSVFPSTDFKPEKNQRLLRQKSSFSSCIALSCDVKSQTHSAILIYHWSSPCVCHPVVAVLWAFVLPVQGFMSVPALIHLSATCSPSQPPC